MISLYNYYLINTWHRKIMHHTDSIMAYLGDSDYTSFIKSYGIYILVTLFQSELKSRQILTIVSTGGENLMESYVMHFGIIISFWFFLLFIFILSNLFAKHNLITSTSKQLQRIELVPLRFSNTPLTIFWVQGKVLSGQFKYFWA